jgi:hypothetical protein
MLQCRILSPTLISQEIGMNLSKHMEFIFLGALALIGVTAAATAAVPKLLAPLKANVQVSKVEASAIPTVVVKTKRLTAEEKAALDR